MKTLKKSKRILVLTLALTLILGISSTALAAYPLLPVEPPQKPDTGMISPDQPTPPNYVTVMAVPSYGGTVYGSGYYAFGEQVYIRAHPNPGYRFVGWYFNDNRQADSQYFTFYAFGEDITVVASFERYAEAVPTPPLPAPQPTPTPTPITPAAPGGTPPAPGVIGVIIGGNWVQYDVPPRTENNRTLVPFRATLEALGATVDWNAQTQTVTATRGIQRISLVLGQSYATVNGNRVALDVPAREEGGRTLVPLRFVSENLGANVNWDPQTLVITITQAPIFS